MAALKNHTGLVAGVAVLILAIGGGLLNLPLLPVLLGCMLIGIAAAARSNGPYVWRKLIALIPILVAVTFFIFILTSLLPGDPAVNILGPGATPEAVEEIGRAHV